MPLRMRLKPVSEPEPDTHLAATRRCNGLPGVATRYWPWFCITGASACVCVWECVLDGAWGRRGWTNWSSGNQNYNKCELPMPSKSVSNGTQRRSKWKPNTAKPNDIFPAILADAQLARTYKQFPVPLAPILRVIIRPSPFTLSRITSYRKPCDFLSKIADGSFMSQSVSYQITIYTATGLGWVSSWSILHGEYRVSRSALNKFSEFQFDFWGDRSASISVSQTESWKWIWME